MDGLCVGVIGLGLGRHFVSACAAHDAVGRLVICDRDAERLREARQAQPRVAAAYGDLAEMLDAERLDAVSIVTPDDLHRPHAEACFRAGCHVLLTKPLATNLDDARAILRAAEAAGRKLMVAHERRFRSRYRRIRERLDSGTLGEVVHLRIDTIQDKRGQFARSPWYASARAGRTALLGTGIHQVDLLRFLVGEPIESVFAFGNRLGELAFPGDTTTAALFRFRGGAIGQVTVSYQAHWPKGGGMGDSLCLVATGGVVVDDRLALDGGDGWEPLPRDEKPIVAGTGGCVRAFLEAIVRDEPVPVAGTDAFASLAACVAADESAASGQATAPAPVNASGNGG